MDRRLIDPGMTTKFQEQMATEIDSMVEPLNVIGSYSKNEMANKVNVTLWSLTQ